MGMTVKQKYLYACKYAIEQLKRKGSCSLAMDIHSDNPIVVKWKDVLDWIDEEYDNDEKYEVEDGNNRA